MTSRVAEGSSLGVVLGAPGEMASQTIFQPSPPLHVNHWMSPTLQTLQTNQRGFFPCPPGKEGGMSPAEGQGQELSGLSPALPLSGLCPVLFMKPNVLPQNI